MSECSTPDIVDWRSLPVVPIEELHGDAVIHRNNEALKKLVCCRPPVIRVGSLLDDRSYVNGTDTIVHSPIIHSIHLLASRHSVLMFSRFIYAMRFAPTLCDRSPVDIFIVVASITSHD
jgi:hypothetical protein